jgi:hypothetical protein
MQVIFLSVTCFSTVVLTFLGLTLLGLFLHDLMLCVVGFIPLALTVAFFVKR